jgi:endonuclease/exonuclease/phosphatase (EEP) superfamily protein YafD
MGYILPWLFIPWLVLLPLALWLRTRFLLVMTSLSGILFVLSYGVLFLPGLPPPNTENQFTVMTHNVFIGEPQNANEVLHQIKNHQPDILSLQEFSWSPTVIETQFSTIFQYQDVGPGYAIFSNYPIQECEISWPEGKISGWTHRCVLEIEDRTLTVLNAHLRPPKLHKAKIPGTSIIMLSGVNTDQHDVDFQALLSQVQSIQGPLVVMGDFNATDQTTNYAEIQRYLADSFRERGWGLGFTFTRFRELGIPMWRIDYVFHSPELVALNAEVGDFAGSDHRPVVVRFGFSR